MNKRSFSAFILWILPSFAERTTHTIAHKPSSTRIAAVRFDFLPWRCRLLFSASLQIHWDSLQTPSDIRFMLSASRLLADNSIRYDYLISKKMFTRPERVRIFFLTSVIVKNIKQRSRRLEWKAEWIERRVWVNSAFEVQVGFIQRRLKRLALKSVRAYDSEGTCQLKVGRNIMMFTVIHSFAKTSSTRKPYGNLRVMLQNFDFK